jgi:hypothetical protein
MSRNHKYGGFYINILLKLFQPQKKQRIVLKDIKRKGGMTPREIF